MLLKTTISILLLAAAAAANDKAYVQHNLVSDIAGMADHTDTNLVNAWGLVHGPTTPWWVNANGTSLSILYDGAGNPVPAASPLAVNVPGSPTGIVFNTTPDFQVGSGLAAVFIFATEDGTILGWNPQVSRPNAIVEVPNTTGAVYKGLATGQTGGKNVLYAANFHGGTIDVFDGSWTPVSMPGAFQDSKIPSGYAPFNVQNINGHLFVTYAKQDAAKHDDVAGPGKGYIDEYTQDGKLVMRLDHGPWLNSPWGLAMAPAGFGKLSGRLLVGNFGSGQIATYNPWNGEFEGLMRGKRGKPITIDGLWGLSFGNDAASGPSTTLFFAAGIQDESHGLFGTLLPVNPQAKGGHDDDDDDRAY